MGPDRRVADVNTWSTKKMGKNIEKPNSSYNVVRADDEDEFEVHSYSVSQEMFNGYVETLKYS